MIKYGLKLWSINSDIFKDLDQIIGDDKYNFIELYCLPGKYNEKQLKRLNGHNISIHMPHSQHGFNPIDKNNNSQEIWTDIKRYIDYLGPTEIIMHPEIGDDFNVLKNRLNYFNDKRIIIENMPKYPLPGYKGIFYGYTKEHFELLSNFGCKFCLDFGKATKAALSTGKNPKTYIQDFIKEYKPKYFHISGFDLIEKYDQHNNLFDADIDFLKFIKNILIEYSKGDDVKLLFETPKSNGFELDVKNLKFFKEL